MMPRRLALGVWLLAVPATAEVRSASFPSASLGREVRYVVDLPPSYATSDRRYAVVYALHGLFEDSAFWPTRGLAAILGEQRRAGTVRDFLVVAVDGDDSFFVNHPGGRYQDLVTRDLVAHVDATYRTIARRAARGLLGISMGGYAARGITARVDTPAGDHGYEYVRSVLARSLAFLSERLAAGGPAGEP